MKVIINILLYFIIIQQISYANSQHYSYCNSFTIICAQQLDAKLINTNITHRFYGAISNGLDTLYGLDDGANIMLYASYTLTDQDKIHIQRIQVDKDFQIGIQRSLQISDMPIYITGQINGAWYKDGDQNVFNGISIAGVSWDYGFGQLHSNIGFDHYENQAGFGSAIIWSLNNDWDLVIEGLSSYQSKNAALTFGAVFHTFGHRFKFGIHNSTNIGFRQLIKGNNSEEWVFGFQIHRLMEW